MKPAGEAFRQLVWKDWITEDSFTTGQDGNVEIRGFRGPYTIDVTGPEGMVSSSTKLTLGKDGAEEKITLK
jgi:hypothetical protein